MKGDFSSVPPDSDHHQISELLNDPRENVYPYYHQGKVRSITANDPTGCRDFVPYSIHLHATFLWHR